MRDLWNLPKYMQKGQNTMYILSKEDYDAIPSDYKAIVNGCKMVFEGAIPSNHGKGGTTLLIEGKHFVIK